MSALVDLDKVIMDLDMSTMGTSFNLQLLQNVREDLLKLEKALESLRLERKIVCAELGVRGAELPQENAHHLVSSLNHLRKGIRELVDQSAIPGAGVSEKYHAAWKKVYLMLNSVNDDNENCENVPTIREKK